MGTNERRSPQYQLLTVPEHSPRGTLVGNVTGAVDADEGPNAIVYYFIAGGVHRASAPPALGLRRTLGGHALTLCPVCPQLVTRTRISTYNLTDAC